MAIISRYEGRVGEGRPVLGLQIVKKRYNIDYGEYGKIQSNKMASHSKYH